MSVFRPRSLLDRVFAVGVKANALNGAAELVGGVATWTHAELSEDPHDVVANHLVGVPR